jgi:hypothetical protein
VSTPRIKRRQRAGRVLLWGLIGFVAIQVALSATMERWQPGLRDREYGVKLARLRDRMAEAPRRPLVVVIGSSRVATGLRPMQLLNRPDGASQPLIFNMGIRGAGPLLEVLSLQRLLNEGVKPDCVIFEFWPSACEREVQRLALCRLGWADGWLIRSYASDAGEFTQSWLLERLNPAYSNRFTIMNQLAPKMVADDDGWDRRLDAAGWRPNPVPRNRDHFEKLLAKSKTSHGPNLMAFQVPESSDRALRAALGMCRERGIATALLFMPEAREFQTCYPADVWADVQNYLQVLARETDSAVIDCRDWMADRDFADGYHLLPEGADKFTARFGREVVPKLARSPLKGGR